MTAQIVSFEPAGISPRASRAIRGSAIASAVVIAICATALSYSGLHTLALRAGVEPHLAFVWPVIVDGLQLVGSLGVMYSTLSRISTRYPWFLMLLGTAISVAGNWVSAPQDLTAQVLHASAPLILALVLEELMRVARHKVSEAAATAATAAATRPAVEKTGTSPIETTTPLASSVPASTASAVAPTRAPHATRALPGSDAPVTAEASAPPVRVVRPAQGHAVTEPATQVAGSPDSAEPSDTEPRGTEPRGTEPRGIEVWPTKAAAQAPVLSVSRPALSAHPEEGLPGDVLATTSQAPADDAADNPAVDDPAVTDDQDAPAPTLRERISDYLDAHPDAKAPDVYKALGTDPKYTRTLFKEVLAARTDG